MLAPMDLARSKYLLSVSLLSSGQVEAGITQLTDWAETTPFPFAQGYALLANAYMKLDPANPFEARNWMEKAVARAKLDGQEVNDNWRALLISLYLQQKLFEYAVPHLEVIVDKHKMAADVDVLVFVLTQILEADARAHVLEKYCESDEILTMAQGDDGALVAARPSACTTEILPTPHRH